MMIMMRYLSKPLSDLDVYNHNLQVQSCHEAVLQLMLLFSVFSCVQLNFCGFAKSWAAAKWLRCNIPQYTSQRACVEITYQLNQKTWLYVLHEYNSAQYTHRTTTSKFR